MLATVALVTGLVALAMVGRPAAAATLPSGFQDRLLASTGKPTALAFTPDGRMLVATQPGQLRMYKNGQLLATPALNISSKICANSERGMLGVAVDPNFSTNKYVYLYYTYNKFGVCPTGQPTNANNPVNRVSRFVMSGDTVDPATEKVLIDNIPSPNGNHNAGDLQLRQGRIPLHQRRATAAATIRETRGARGQTTPPATDTSSWERYCE